MVKAIIVDDELPARENLALLLQEFCPNVEVIAKASGIKEAKEKIQSLKPQLIFLDIRMPSGTEGFDLLDSLDEKNFIVIFVTAFKDYAIKAFNANAIHYVLKPIDIDDLKEAVAKAENEILKQTPDFQMYHSTIKALSGAIKSNQYSSRITIHHQKGIKIINDTDIMYLEAEGNCTNLVFKDGKKYLDTRTLAVYENILNPLHFYRIHKSYIINLDYLSEYLHEDGSYVVLKNGTQLSVARSRIPDFIKKIKEG